MIFLLMSVLLEAFRLTKMLGMDNRKYVLCINMCFCLEHCHILLYDLFYFHISCNFMFFMFSEFHLLLQEFLKKLP